MLIDEFNRQESPLVQTQVGHCGCVRVDEMLQRTCRGRQTHPRGPSEWLECYDSASLIDFECHLFWTDHFIIPHKMRIANAWNDFRLRSNWMQIACNEPDTLINERHDEISLKLSASNKILIIKQQKCIGKPRVSQGKEKKNFQYLELQNEWKRMGNWGMDIEGECEKKIERSWEKWMRILHWLYESERVGKYEYHRKYTITRARDIENKSVSKIITSWNDDSHWDIWALLVWTCMTSCSSNFIII